MRTQHRPLLLTTMFSIVIASCGGGSDGSGGATSADNPPSLPPVSTPNPQYVECTSTVPIDAGDPGQPIISMLGAKVINHPMGTAYLDAGAYALDPREGDISTRIQVNGLAGLDTNVVGDYLVRYNEKNDAQLSAVEAVRIVRVNAGTFAKQTARDIGTTRGHMGYYEHLPVNYSDDPDQKFPLIIYQHGWFNARFLTPSTVQAPLSILEDGNLVKVIKDGLWDDSRPFIVLAPQRCTDANEWRVTAAQTRRFIDYAINTYKIDTSRIYMGGHSQGSGNTWDYVTNYPLQLAAIFPVSGGYGSSSGCDLSQTPSWAFIGRNDATVPYQEQVATVNSINDCNPRERARLTVLDGIGHNDIELPIFSLTGLGQGMTAYDVYNQSIFAWLLQHRRP